MNVVSNVPSGMTRSDYNKLANSKIEFIKVKELPTDPDTIKEYPFIYLLIDEDSNKGKLFEYDSNVGDWYVFGGGGADAMMVSSAEYATLSEEEKMSDKFFVIMDEDTFNVEDIDRWLMNVFTGTKEEFDLAVENNEIEDRTFVNITDDFEVLSPITSFIDKTTIPNSDGSITEIYPTLNLKVITATASDTGEVKVVTCTKTDMVGNVLAVKTITIDKNTNIITEVVK